jgi:hypothetical protein
VVAFLVTAVSILVGFKVDQPFLSNLLSELAGIGLGVIVGVYLVDAWIRQDRQVRWSKTRNYVLGSIASHLSDFSVDVLTYMPIKDHRPMSAIIDGRNQPNPSTISAIKEVSAQLRTVTNSPSPTKHRSDYVVELYENSRWDLDQIQRVLTPLVIQSEADQELIDILMSFDMARRDLHNDIISHKLIVTDAAFPALIKLMDMIADVYRIVAKYWRPIVRTIE